MSSVDILNSLHSGCFDTTLTKSLDLNSSNTERIHIFKHIDSHNTYPKRRTAKLLRNYDLKIVDILRTLRFLSYPHKETRKVLKLSSIP